MIAYLDTSAVVKLIVAESGSAVVRELWRTADRVVATTLLYPEARSALARARRAARLTDAAASSAAAELDRLVRRMRLIRPTRSVVWRAGQLAAAHALRGYDAVHLSSAIEAGRAARVVTADFRMAAAARDEGFRVVVPA